MPSSQRVYVGNIGSDIRERDLEKFFKGFGKIGDIAVKNGYGFVDFDDHRDADDAVHDLDGKDFRGSRIRVELARDRRDRDRDGGDRRGGGRDGGRGGGRYDDRGGGRRDDRRGGFNDRRGGGGGARGGNPPGRKTEFRCVVENISAATSWQSRSALRLPKPVICEILLNFLTSEVMASANFILLLPLLTKLRNFGLV